MPFDNATEAHMGYADLIRTLQALPQDKQAEVFDFVDFLAARARREGRVDATTSADVQPITAFFQRPFRVESFQPLSRDEANAR
ncbi:hypothetical protein [Sphaerotilus sp.]|uniref:hypothetical protein n=1 Tax=Sphaerotilus sp. TaxID=2093942 RepID=UPI002ACE7C26|nr:hypothetical protein [Sphaerotilus sp.]MDZ7855044.1 hypothetical protein [Sphaerotilus sp.]